MVVRATTRPTKAAKTTAALRKKSTVVEPTRRLSSLSSGMGLAPRHATGDAQLGRTGTRVGGDLVVCGDQRLFGDQLQQRFAAALADGQLRRADATLGVGAKCVFDGAIFER